MISVQDIREMIRGMITRTEETVEPDEDDGDESKAFSVTGNYRK